MTPRHYRADLLLAKNIRALLTVRGADQKDLARWCGHAPAWLSKILVGQRGIQIKELGMIADFFGVQVADLFQFGISTDRRRGERRQTHDRRAGKDRRTRFAGQIHPGATVTFFPRARDDDNGVE
jgi:DNA-binding Xre family transcriptional regulator